MLEVRVNLVGLIGDDVSGREVSPSVSDLALPPVLVAPVDDVDDLSPAEFELAGFLWLEVIHGTNQTLQR